ncbi:MAG: hypothetical protein H5U28_04130 [Burkholderiaceae bacterium]|nr:hypothetical protein [Burkholderiaceae bacterium]
MPAERTAPPAPSRHEHTAALAATIAALAACILYGPAVLAPTSVGWMLHGDPAQHLVGLAHFLAEPWHWPPGAIHRLAPATSIVFTDSIPWLALLLKALHWPPAWQPLGLWLVFCHAASAALSALWLRRMGVGTLGAGSAAVLLAFAPMVLLRTYGHESLLAHFLLPGALLLASRPWSRSSPWRWGGWLLLALGIHPYWLPMLLPWALAAAWQAWRRRQRSGARLLLQGGLIAIALWACALLLGYGIGQGEISASGLGFYSANLLTWLDPMDWPAFLAAYGRDPALGAPWSRWWPALGQSTLGQYEGFAWLGSGILALALLCVLHAVWQALRRVRHRPATQAPRAALTVPKSPATPAFEPPWIGLWLGAGLLALLAFSPTWGWGAHILVTWPLPERVLHWLGVFRASGRFIWPLSWLLALTLCARVGRWRGGGVVLLLALILQAADLSPKLRELHARFHHPVPDSVAPLRAPEWPALLTRCQRLHLLTADIQAGPQWAPPAWLAAQYSASVQPFPSARLNPAYQAAQAQHIAALAQGQGWDAHTLYLSWPGALDPSLPPRLREQAQRQVEATTLQLDGYTVWVPAPCAILHGAF